MALTSLLVHLADDADHMARLRVAHALARRHRAHVIALYIAPEIGMPAAVEGRGASTRFIREAAESRREHARRVQAEFDRWCAAHGVTGDWHGEQGESLQVLARYSLYADLAVVSQSDPECLEEMVSNALPEHLAMVGGCPALILPQGFDAGRPVGRRILIAWKPRRSCARAVHDAMPLLQTADHVRILQIEPDGEQMANAGRLLEFLQRHDVAAEQATAPRDGRPVADALYHAAAVGAFDLMVAGSYSRSRLSELVAGGTTRDLLAGAPLPILMAH